MITKINNWIYTVPIDSIIRFTLVATIIEQVDNIDPDVDWVASKYMIPLREVKEKDKSCRKCVAGDWTPFFPIIVILQHFRRLVAHTSMVLTERIWSTIVDWLA